MRKMSPINRLTITLSPYYREKLELMSDFFGCSQAEVVRIALMKLWEEER
ncbi:hypothetical protein [Methanolobus sp.]|nr:hypothetical protein [Methanolobus sp.]